MNAKPDVQEKLAALRADFVRKLPERLQRITDLWRTLTLVNWSADGFTLFHRMVHSLAGSAGTFGLGELGAAAHKIDLLCLDGERSDAQPDAGQRQQIGALTAALAKIDYLAERPSPVAPDLEPVDEAGVQARVFIVDDDPHMRNLLLALIEHLGHTVEGFGDLASMQSALKDVPPDVIVMDIMLGEESNAGIDAVAALKREYGPAVKVLFISARGDMGARLKAVRVGGDAYLSKPIDANELALRLSELTQAGPGNGSQRVLVVDDDEDFNALTEAVLSEQGMTVRTVANPLRLMEPLMEFRPHLILLDLYMPHCDGFELVRLIRQHSEFAATPIVFLSAETDAGKQRDAIRMGGDDFLVKPVTPEHLVTMVSSRLRRGLVLSRKVRYLGDRDGATGLYNRRYFYSRIMYVASSHAGERPASLLLAGVDGLGDLAGKLRAQDVDRIVAGIANELHGAFPKPLVVARLSDDVVGLLVTAVEPAKAAVRAEAVRKTIGRRVLEFGDCSASVTCSMGITAVTNGLANADEAIYAADVALEIARTDGEPHVHVHVPAQDVAAAREGDEQCLQSIREALEKDRFALVYQPIVTLSGGHDAKYDVFVRMHDERGDELLAGRFVPVAERSQRMGEIDRRVLEHAIRSIAERQRTEDQVTLFVKLSLQSLVDPELPAFLESHLAAAQVNGKHLVLEIAEPTAKAKLKEVKVLCGRVKKLCCGIALEKFGAGLDSSRLLAHLPVDYIKLDGSFMRELWNNTVNQDSVRSIAQAAQAHGILTIAEFVEDANSLAVLWQCGVNYTQGHFLAAPSEGMDYDFRHEAE